MKKITAYVNPVRVHWLVEELEAIGIHEIMVTEYFSQLSRISRFIFICSDDSVKQASHLIHLIGSNGAPGDHFIDVKEFQPKALDVPSMGMRISPLED